MRRPVLLLAGALLLLAGLAGLALRDGRFLARTGPDAPPAWSGPPTAGPEASPTRDAAAAAIERARALVADIARRHGEPPPGHVGGRAFRNREGRLPPGRYREYDVHPQVSGRGRGPERVVIEQRSGRAYYTGDHYRTFVPLDVPP
jgi:ribonuclease T1